MNLRQFTVLVMVLMALIGAATWVLWSDRLAWKQADTLAGNKVLPALMAASVAEISLGDAQHDVRLVKQGDDWVVRERDDFKADLPRIADLLSRVVNMRIAQTEKISKDKLGDFDLISPVAVRSMITSAAAPIAGQGTVMSLKESSGKTLATLLLGKKLFRKGMIQSNDGMPPREGDVAYGRYILAGDTVMAMNEPLEFASANPAQWISKDLFRIPVAGSITSIGPDGKERFTLTKEGGIWGWPDGDHPDLQKAQDVASSLYLVQAKDIVADPAKVQTGLDKPVTIRAVTPYGITYHVKLGNKADEHSYYMLFAMSGELSQNRPAMPGEAPDDKAKSDKAYLDQLPSFVEELNRERERTKWTYKMPRYPAEQLIRTREQLLPEKKPVQTTP